MMASDKNDRAPAVATVQPEEGSTEMVLHHIFILSLFLSCLFVVFKVIAPGGVNKIV